MVPWIVYTYKGTPSEVLQQLKTMHLPVEANSTFYGAACPWSNPLQIPLLTVPGFW